MSTKFVFVTGGVVGLFLAIPYWKGKYSRPRVKIPVQTADKSKGGNHNA